MWQVKKQSRTCPQKWLPHHNLNDTEIAALAMDWFGGKYNTEGDLIAALTVMEVLTAEGEFLQFGDILVIKKLD